MLVCCRSCRTPSGLWNNAVAPLPRASCPLLRSRAARFWRLSSGCAGLSRDTAAKRGFVCQLRGDLGVGCGVFWAFPGAGSTTVNLCLNKTPGRWRVDKTGQETLVAATVMQACFLIHELPKCGSISCFSRAGGLPGARRGRGASLGPRQYPVSFFRSCPRFARAFRLCSWPASTLTPMPVVCAATPLMPMVPRLSLAPGHLDISDACRAHAMRASAGGMLASSVIIRLHGQWCRRGCPAAMRAAGRRLWGS